VEAIKQTFYGDIMKKKTFLLKSSKNKNIKTTTKACTLVVLRLPHSD